jgi:hypothetical protein
MTIESSGPPSAASFAIPLLWEVSRATQTGRIEDPRRWAEEAIREVNDGELLGAFAAYIDRTDNDVDLSRRVELPDDDEAHFIDTDSDLFRALLVALLLRPAVSDADLAPIGRAMQHRLEPLQAIAESMKSQGVWDRLPATGDAGLDAALGRIRGAVTRAREEEAAQVASLEIDQRFLDEFRAETQRTADRIFPRDLIRRVGSIAYVNRTVVRTHTVRITMPRSMVVEHEARADPGELGDHAGHMVAAHESRLLNLALTRLRRRTFGEANVVRRISAAISAAEEAGREARLLLLPFDWQVIQRLIDAGLMTREPDQSRNVAGRIGPIEVLQHVGDESSGYLFAAPGAIELQARGAEGSWLDMTVRAIDTDDAGLESGGPRVEVAMTERARIVLGRGTIWRIAIAES